MKETIQDLKNEMETIKKAQSKGILEMKNMRKLSATTNTSTNSRTQGMEDRISSAEDTKEEIELLVK